MNADKAEIFLLTTENPDTLRRTKRMDAVANRELILATAERLFAERGIENVCMTAIAESAGVGKGTLYRGFANKGELCLALMDEAMRVFQNQTLKTLRETYDQPALARLDTFLNSLVYFMEGQAPLFREVQRQGPGQSEGVAGEVSASMWLPWLRTTLAILLQQAERNGEAGNLDVSYLVDAILAPLNADLFLYQREILGFDLERISVSWRQLIIEGVRGKVTKQPGSL